MTQAHFPSRRRAIWTVAVFSFAGVVAYAHRLILGVLVDPMRHDLHIDDVQISLLQGAAFAIVYVLAGLPLGRLADRTHRLRLVFLGSLLWSLGTMLCGIASSFGWLFAARLLVGIGEATLAPAAVSVIADSVRPEHRGTALGIFFMGTIVGAPAAVVVGGSLLSLAQAGHFAFVPWLGSLAPWREVLILSGAAGFIVPVLVATLREPQRKERLGETSLRQALRRLSLDKRTLIPIYVGLALLAIGDYSLTAWFPAVLSRGFAMAPQEIATLFATITIAAAIAGALIGGVVSDRVARNGGPRVRLFAAAAAAAIAGLGVCLVAAPTSPTAVAGLVIWTLASSVGSIGAFAALQVLIPNDYRGVGVSIAAFFNTLLGLGLGPSLIALALKQLYGDPTVVGFAITTVILPAALLAALVLVLAGRELRARAQATGQPAQNRPFKV